jgi:hypothetical protein
LLGCRRLRLLDGCRVGRSAVVSLGDIRRYCCVLRGCVRRLAGGVDRGRLFRGAARAELAGRGDIFVVGRVIRVLALAVTARATGTAGGGVVVVSAGEPACRLLDGFFWLGFGGAGWAAVVVTSLVAA